MNIPDEAVVSELISLQALASKTRGGTPLRHEYRISGDRLAELAAEVMTKHAMSARDLSRLMGLDPLIMQRFMMRRGLIEMTPGAAQHIPEYKNKVQSGMEGHRKAECKHGHDLTLPDSRNSQGRCRECKNAYQRRRKQVAPKAYRFAGAGE